MKFIIMKKKGIYYLLCLFLLMNSCCFVVNQGGGGVSLNIRESHERGVFVSEYAPPVNPLKINDSIVINVKHAWLEHRWMYAGRCNEKTQIDTNNNYQLIVISDDKSLKGHLRNWRIGETLETAFYGTYKDAIIIKLHRLPQKDTLEWPVHPAYPRDTSSEWPVVGEFQLVRK